MKHDRKPPMRLYVGILVVLVVAFLSLSFIPHTNPVTNDVTVKSFSSPEEVKQFLQRYSLYDYSGDYRYQTLAEAAAPQGQATDAANGNVIKSGSEYSQTNVQIAGVDESDIVKTDGSYIYVAGTDTISIVDADPANARVLSEISRRALGMFINGDKLI